MNMDEEAVEKNEIFRKDFKADLKKAELSVKKLIKDDRR